MPLSPIAALTLPRRASRSRRFASTGRWTAPWYRAGTTAAASSARRTSACVPFAARASRRRSGPSACDPLKSRPRFFFFFPHDHSSWARPMDRQTTISIALPSVYFAKVSNPTWSVCEAGFDARDCGGLLWMRKTRNGRIKLFNQVVDDDQCSRSTYPDPLAIARMCIAPGSRVLTTRGGGSLVLGNVGIC